MFLKTCSNSSEHLYCKHCQRQNGHSHVFLSVSSIYCPTLYQWQVTSEKIFHFLACSSGSLQPVDLHTSPLIFNEISPCSKARDRIHHSRFKITKKNSPNISKARWLFSHWLRTNVCLILVFICCKRKSRKSRKNKTLKQEQGVRSESRHCPVWGKGQTWFEHKLNVCKKKKLTSAFWIPFIQGIKASVYF